MNVSELARKLRVNSNDLLQILPEFGFGLGKRAIKVDNKVADQIIKAWPRITRELERKKRAAEEERAAQLREENRAQRKAVEIPQILTVRELAAVLDRPVNEVIKHLMKSGVLASLNERIDFDTASIVADDLGITLKKTSAESEATSTTQEKLATLLKTEAGATLEPRPPVVVVMGHVDHGKTKLLDSIRKTNVIDTEAGGITQHIGAYQVERNGSLITFIDTPGHEAFTAMRSRGARVADIAILVVAADDSIQMQTKEAIKIIQQAKLPMVVAINKVDKEAANVEKVKKDLSELNLIPEEWGGNTICVPISAKAGTGIDKLLDAIVLVTEMEKDKIVADETKTGVATVIESHISKGEGPVATVIVQRGIVREREYVATGDYNLGKIRGMKNFKQQPIAEAKPSTPVQITGLKFAPTVGDIIEVIDDATRKEKKEKTYESHKEESVLIRKVTEQESEGVRKLNLIIRADVLGSLEAIVESLTKLDYREAKVQVVSKGLGNITDGDVLLAQNSGAQLIGFHVKTVPTAEKLAKDNDIEIRYFKIIYDLINEVKKRLIELLPKKVVRTDLGTGKVLAVFKRGTNSMIVGVKVLSGRFVPGASIDLLKQKTVHTSGTIKGIKVGKQEVRDVVEGQECGIEYIGAPDIEIGDSVVVYSQVEQAQG